MTQRSIPAAALADIESEAPLDALLPFLLVEHPNLSDPIRVVSDHFDYYWGGSLWSGVIFDAVPLTDENRPAGAELIVQNVDRRIGQALEKANEPPRVSLWLLSSASFDLSVNPRTELGVTTPIYGFTEFDLKDVRADVSTISGTVGLRDFATEPWPFVRATIDRAPGLWW